MRLGAVVAVLLGGAPSIRADVGASLPRLGRMAGPPTRPQTEAIAVVVRETVAVLGAVKFAPASFTVPGQVQAHAPSAPGRFFP